MRDGLLPAEAAHVFMVSGADAASHPYEAAMKRHPAFRSGRAPAVSKTIVERTIAECVAIATSDAVTDARFAGAESIARHGIRAVMTAPIATRERVLGAIYVGSDAADFLFSQAELSLLTAIAFHAAIVLGNIRSAGG